MVIQKVHISNYRTFINFEWEPTESMNIIVGNNEAGKSTLLEAIQLTLNGRVNGKWVGDELNPYWFNTEVVKEFFNNIKKDKNTLPPSILIEIYLKKDSIPQIIRGKNNSLKKDCPGISLTIEPDPDYRDQFLNYLSQDHPPILPIEYYQIKWEGFDGNPLRKRPMEISTTIIDGRTIQSYRGVDYQTRQMLTDYVGENESADISVAYRLARHNLTKDILGDVNQRIKEETRNIIDYNLELHMDQSSAVHWESTVIPQVNQVPFSMAGQGQQVLMKIALALQRTSENESFIFIEEPENHLSHTTLTKAVKQIEELAKDKQTFIATHSSYVLNRLGLDKLTLLHEGKNASFKDLSPDTINYFKKQSGYETLRIVLARKLVIVEGPSDEMIFNRAYHDLYGSYPIDDEIDVIAQGTRNRRGLELSYVLDRPLAVLRDADKQAPEYWKNLASPYLLSQKREMFIGDPELGSTLEPQIISANKDDLPKLREIIQCPDDEDIKKFMENNKTEVAWRIAESQKKISYPQYILDAIDFMVTL